VDASVSVNGDAADRSPDGVARSAASPFARPDDLPASREVAARPDGVGDEVAARPDGASDEVAEAEAYWSDGHVTRADLDAEPSLHEANHRHGNDLDQLAARLVNGDLNGKPVADVVDLDRIERAVREILIALGEDPDRDGLQRTPARVARAYAELFAGLRVDPAEVLTTTFESCHEELVLVRDIQVFSLCEHHLLPFHGVAHIGYIPGTSGRITGLSKLARLVEVYSRRPQVQERLTSQVADLLLKALDARGVIVVLDCEHMCMAMRGIQKAGARTVTSAVRGLLQVDPKSRSEAMSLIMRG
jgi:GTP cyclohydrolase IA